VVLGVGHRGWCSFAGRTGRGRGVGGNDGDPGELRVLVEEVLHVGDRDVLAAAGDHVLGPAGDALSNVMAALVRPS
jgi:hypothetical protein